MPADHGETIVTPYLYWDRDDAEMDEGRGYNVVVPGAATAARFSNPREALEELHRVSGAPTPDTRWQDDEVQFARLLCELVAAGQPSDQVMQSLQEAMDLPESAIDELFEHAHRTWETAKARITGTPPVDDALPRPRSLYRHIAVIWAEEDMTTWGEDSAYVENDPLVIAAKESFGGGALCTSFSAELVEDPPYMEFFHEMDDLGEE